MPRNARSVMRGLARRVRAAAGYSLIELMSVLAVVAVIIAIAAPTVQTHVALQQIRGAAREVVEVLRDARDSAMNEGVPRYVAFTPPRTYQVWMYDDSAGQWVQEGRAVSLSESVSFETADVTFPSVADAPEGTGESVPEDSAYFDTRGRYPFDATQPSSYTITLHGGLGRTETLTLWRNTGLVTGL